MYQKFIHHGQKKTPNLCQGDITKATTQNHRITEGMMLQGISKVVYYIIPMQKSVSWNRLLGPLLIQGRQRLHTFSDKPVLLFWKPGRDLEWSLFCHRHCSLTHKTSDPLLTVRACIHTQLQKATESSLQTLRRVLSFTLRSKWASLGYRGTQL